MENTYRLVTLQLHFSKWIVAPTKDNAIEKANIFWKDEDILSFSTSAICYQNVIDKITEQPTANIEWLVQARVEFRKADQSKVIRKAISNSWQTEEEN